MTKYLAKAKKGCTFISTNGNGEFLDEYRYRVFSNESDIREWEARKSIEIYGQVRDDATNEKLDEYLKDGEEGFKKFFEEFALQAKKAEAPKKVEAEVKKEDEEVKPEIKISTAKKNKHSKRQ